jgi:hypothetical protein
MLKGGTKLLSLCRACRLQRSAIHTTSPNILVLLLIQHLYLNHLIFYTYKTIHRFYVFTTLLGKIVIERDELIWKRAFLLNLSGFLKARPYSAKTFGRGLASSGTYGY